MIDTVRMWMFGVLNGDFVMGHMQEEAPGAVCAL